MIRVGIIGGAGYTAGELLRLLLNHPEVEIGFVHSSSNAGVALDNIHEGLLGETDKCFDAAFDLKAVDVVFLCQGHGFSQKFWEENERPDGLRVIDLSQDYRDGHDGYVYGLPEAFAHQAKDCMSLANPGCFATAIQLALLPLANAGKLFSEIHVTAVTGSTGAGVKPGATTHFSWRAGNMSVYKAFSHQHLHEIRQTLSRLQPGFDAGISFVPVRGDFTRGIFAMVYLDTDMLLDDAVSLYKRYYADARFTHVSDRSVDLKQVVNTNKCAVSLEKHGSKLLIVSAIDNLLKGAAGQAVQNMNLMFGLPEDCGLRLKPSAF